MKVKKFENFENNQYKLGTPIKVSDINTDFLKSITEKIEDAFIIIEDDLAIKIKLIDYGVLKDRDIYPININYLDHDKIADYTNLYVDVILLSIPDAINSLNWEGFKELDTIIKLATITKKIFKTLFNSDKCYVKIDHFESIITIVIPNE